MTCLDGKQHVSFYMDITSERHAQDSPYCMLDYSSHPSIELRQFDEENFKSLFRCRKSKYTDMKGYSKLNMKPNRPSSQRKDFIRSNEAPGDNFSKTENHHVFRNNEKEKHLSFPTSAWTIGKSKSSNIHRSSHIHGEAERHKRQNMTTMSVKNDSFTHRVCPCNCSSINKNCFHTTDSSHYKMTKFNYMRHPAPTDILQKAPGRFSNLQRRTNLVNHPDVMDNDIYNRKNISMKTSPEYNSIKDTPHNLFLSAMIKIGYILRTCRLKEECVSIRTRKQNCVSRKWTFWILFTLLLMRTDSKR